MAPAANARKYGRSGVTWTASSAVRKPPTGSTAPDSIPYRNAFFLLMPSPTSGMDTIAPSGKFCIAIPMESANAPVMDTPILPMAAPAYTTPTAMPSGILWSVTANIIMVVF